MNAAMVDLLFKYGKACNTTLIPRHSNKIGTESARLVLLSVLNILLLFISVILTAIFRSKITLWIHVLTVEWTYVTVTITV